MHCFSFLENCCYANIPWPFDDCWVYYVARRTILFIFFVLPEVLLECRLSKLLEINKFLNVWFEEAVFRLLTDRLFSYLLFFVWALCFFFPNVTFFLWCWY
jgi:hypothetical protein